MSRFQNTTSGVIVSVADRKDHRFASGWRPVGSVTPHSETPDKSWKVADLKAYAEENSIDLLDATKKDDILAAIDLHEPEGSADDSDESDEK